MTRGPLVRVSRRRRRGPTIGAATEARAPASPQSVTRCAMVKRKRNPRPAMQDRVELQEIVPHPRYGRTVVPSGCEATEAQIRGSFYGYRDETIFPQSAIPADLTRQNFTTFPRGYYVDILKVCRACGRSFLFFAREQRHWYEVLRFYIDADCVH